MSIPLRPTRSRAAFTALGHLSFESQIGHRVFCIFFFLFLLFAAANGGGNKPVITADTG